jgi:hypothetical protein
MAEEMKKQNGDAADEKKGDIPAFQPPPPKPAKEAVEAETGAGDAVHEAQPKSQEAPHPALSPEYRGEGEKAPAHGHGVLHAIKEVIVRSYAAVLLVAVLVPGIWAVFYLYQTVFRPAQPPKRLLEWQTRIDVGALRAKDVEGVTGAADRAPLGHYHRLERWFQPDENNGCTVSGCHEPLPHTSKMKVPAFANFHTTFLTCQMCHVAPEQTAAVGWISTVSAAAQIPPALIQLASYMETSKQDRADKPAATHATIVRLLRESIAAAGADESLSDLLVQFDTSQPGSPVWRQAEARLTQELPLHMRGEYGAKLARGAAVYAADASKLRDSAAQFLKSPEGSEQRKQVRQSIHSSVTKSPAQCTSCHSDGAVKLDFEKLGYAPSRAKGLEHLELANQMQRIRNGERFEIPDLLRGKE